MTRICVWAAAVGVLVGCAQPAGGPSRSSGSLAITRDDRLLYAADTDNDVLAVIDLEREVLLDQIPVGESPSRVLLGWDDTVYVANRRSSSISVVRRGESTVHATIATDPDPVGLSLSRDGRTLYVVCATAADAAEFGTLSAFDTHSLSRLWTLNVGEEPRAIALLSDDRALVSLYRQGSVVEVDLKSPSVIGTNLEPYQQLNLSFKQAGYPATYYEGTSGSFGIYVRFKPRGASDLIATPDGKRIFLAAQIARESRILVGAEAGYYPGQGPRAWSSVTSPALFTLDLDAEQKVRPAVDDILWNAPTQSTTQDHPQTSYAPVREDLGLLPLQGATVGAVDSASAWMYVVHRESRALAAISATTREARPESVTTTDDLYNNQYYDDFRLPSVHSTAEIGAGSDGVALKNDGKQVFVYSQFEHAVYVVEHDAATGGIVSKGKLGGLTVAAEVLSQDAAAGRKLFYDARDLRLSPANGPVACSNCHFEGRDDGHVWQLPSGPRQTPSLAGRGILRTAPYNWTGDRDSMDTFMHDAVVTRMGGKGLDADAVRQLSAFIGTLAPPPNPYQLAAPSPEQQRGRAAFEKAQCHSCHGGEWFTNNGAADVATAMQGVNVPSLRGLARTAPYLHDGSVLTLRERLVQNPGDQHGKTSSLSQEELSDLLAYLRSL
jgi:DNA-binding beta-propeller fold protein YncE